MRTCLPGIRLATLGLLGSMCLLSPSLKAQPQPVPYILKDTLHHLVDLVDHIQVLADSTGETFQQVRAFRRQGRFRDLRTLKQPLPHDITYWAYLRLDNQTHHDSLWILDHYITGLVDVFFQQPDGSYQMLRTGRYVPDKQKDQTHGHRSNVQLNIPPGATREVYVRLREIDHQPIRIRMGIAPLSFWQTLDLDPRKNTINFFEGIFWVMVLYNLILFFSTRMTAYLFYALYLICVAIFVLYAVGPLQSPSFGDPVWHQHIGYLAFGAINIFYFLFGRSFLHTRELIPNWDPWLKRYIWLKLAVLIILQGWMALTFNLKDILATEFGMLFLDVLLSLALFVRLLQTQSKLALYFVIGSAAVITIGLSLAALGHIFGLRHTFVIFLSTIVVEIIFFSLGLGYKIRQSEKEKLAAQAEQLKAQEALNRELSKINTAFGRFVPHEFLKSLGHETILDVNLGDSVEKEVTVLFSDIRDYTSLSEKMTPSENFQFLNAYLGRVGPVIQAHGGFVNQYYGDGIMALFLNSPEAAIRSALEIHQVLVAYNAHRAEKGRRPIRLGIGIHSGPLMMGVIGDTLRMEAGVVADTVNTASRMEGLTKHYRASTLASETAFQGIKDPGAFPYRFLGRVQVKGRSEPVGVYEFFGGDPEEVKKEKSATLTMFNEGLEHYYRKDFVRAVHCFDQVLAQAPNDATALHYQGLSTRFLAEGVPEYWTGVERLEKK